MKSLLTSCVAVALSFHLTLACTPLLASHQNTARDSAGIRIVYSAEPAIPSPETWFVDPTAEVSIGQTEGPEEYVFPSVTAGTILSDGTIVTAVSARGRTIGIRYFDESGRFLVSTPVEDFPFVAGENCTLG